MILTYFFGLWKNVSTDAPIYDFDLHFFVQREISILMYLFIILTYLLGLRRNINTCTDVPVYDPDLLSWSEEKYQYMH